MRTLRHGSIKCIALVHSYKVVEWVFKPKPLHQSQASYQTPGLLAHFCLPFLPYLLTIFLSTYYVLCTVLIPALHL